MLQRTSLPTAATSVTTSDIAESLQRSWERGALHSLQQTLRLPGTWQQYLVLCAILAVVVAGMTFQVLLAVQIAKAESQVAQLRSAYERIERRNAELVYQLAINSSLEAMQQKAVEQGFGPATGRTYIFRDQLAVRAAAGPTLRPTPTEQLRTIASPGWLEQSQQWMHGARQSAQAGLSQFVRDVMGRVQ